MRPSASTSGTVSVSPTALTRDAMIPTASSTDIIGPPKAKQSSESCTMFRYRLANTQGALYLGAGECHANLRPAMKIERTSAPLIVPDPADPRLTERVTGTDQTGARTEIRVPVERPLTLYLNAQEIVTMMTINDYPEYLALGYLLNQNMLKYDDVVTEVEYDDDLQVVVVRTEHHTNFEAKLKKRTQTSGCAQGTAFGDLLEAFEKVELPKAELRTSWLYQMTQTINTMPSLYLEAGAIHGCVLCKEGTPVCYTEDVGRHNAADKIAGWIYSHGVDPADKILYTTR